VCVAIDPGYSITPSIIGRSEVESLREAIERDMLTRTRAGARHLMRSAPVAAIAHDARLLEIARRMVGAGAVAFRATLFDKSPRSNWLITWHQDTALPVRERRDVPEWGPWSTKNGIVYAHAPAAALERVVALRLSLDDSAADNGPLRVLPGSHTRGVMTDDEIALLVRSSSPVDCLVPAGGLVAMRPLVVHASSKATSDRPRRVLHIEYAESLAIHEGLELALA
jgi:ectoine hydroxylase-related dioxygenase (phytanoyl-CoA dioxygenase family)